jgi:hypothetical protein
VHLGSVLDPISIACGLVLADSGWYVCAQEVDLHTKCTDHKDFADKPVEAAKPIDLEAPPKSASSSEAIYGRRCPGLGK